MNEKKKLLIYAHYYVPDVASTGQILQELAEGMLEAFDVTVICVVPSYEGMIEECYKSKKYYFENIDGVKVIRVRVPEFSKENKLSRIKNILVYLMRAMAATFKAGHQDYVFSISQPPILGGLLGVWGKWMKRAKYIYNIQDFNPEQIMAVGYSKNAALMKAMLALDKFSCRCSDLVITVGRDLTATLEKRFAGKKTPRYALINNWIDEKAIYPLPKTEASVAAFRQTYGLTDKFVIMYSGNIGLYYDLENLIRVIERFKPGTKTADGREVCFAFVGAGSMLETLRTYVNEHQMTNVRFIPYQDKKKLVSSLNGADVHWVVNAKGIKGVSCPSKYYGVAAVGLPVIGVLEAGSEIRMLIEETRGGLVSAPGDYDAVETNLRWFIEEAAQSELDALGQRGREYLEANLTREISIQRYIQEIQKI